MLRKNPSLFILTFIGLGIASADRLQLPAGYLVLGSLLCLVSASLMVLKHLRPLGVLLLGLSIGLAAAAHFSLKYVIDSPRHLRQLVKAPEVFHVHGRVTDWPELKPGRTEIRLAVDSLIAVRDAGMTYRDVDGDLLLKITDTTTALQRGDRIALFGRVYPVNRDKLTTGFDYGRYLHLKGIHGVIYLPTALNIRFDRRNAFGFVPWVDRLRDAIRNTFETNLSPVSSALAGGFLIGETRNIPPDIYRLFRDSGTLHLLAVSGSNVALVILFFIWVMRPLRVKPASRSIFLMVVILVFAGLSYGDPSVIRASVMAGLVIVARSLGRVYDLNNIIALAAAMILLVSPSQLYDVGFQLSFITAWGLIFFVPRITALFEHRQERWWYRWGVFPLIVCFVAQVCSTPIVAFHFGRIPWLALPANLVIVPMVAAGVVMLMILLAAAMVSPLLGAWVGSIVDVLLRAVVVVLVWFGGDRWPPLQTGNLLSGDWGGAAIVLTYAFLIVLGLAFHSRGARRLAAISLLVLVNLGLGISLVAWGSEPAANIQVHPIPGGALGVIDHGRPPGFELIITSLEARDYPLDERVFEPLLEHLGVIRVNRLFVLNADFDALDDIARLARSTVDRELCLASELAPSWRDHVARDTTDNDQPPTVFFGGAAASDSLGLAAADGEVRCLLPGGLVIFVNNLDTDLASAGDISPAVVVIGGPWSPSIADLIELKDSGFTASVCSKFEHGGDDWPDSEINPDAVPPDFIHDLSRNGYWQLRGAPSGR